MIDSKINTGKFHYFLDDVLIQRPGITTHDKTSGYFVVQKREVSYRFHLHQHPFVQPLIQRLIRQGTRGLQAADTDFDKDKTSLPFGVDVSLQSDVAVTLPKEARIGLPGDVQVNGTTLGKGSEFKLSAPATASLPTGTACTLEEQMKQTPFPQELYKPASPMKAVVSFDSPVRLTAPTAVTAPDGSAKTLPADTSVILAAKTTFQIPANADLFINRRRLQPVKSLFDDFFNDTYSPKQALICQPYPVKDLDFSSGGAYAVYNWELFFHVPFTIAVNLSKNQRFAEAQQWFHYLFDPTDDSDGPTPERFWKVRPFQTTDVHKIEEILVNLATGADANLRNETTRSLDAWKDAPFRPHVVARYRQQAYMVKTVMAYLDNLIAWGDSLFRQDTGESIDEALMIYVLATNILGPRPLPVPKKGSVRPQTYANMRSDLRQFGTVMREMEADLPFDLMPSPAPTQGDSLQSATLRSLGKALYFCVPRNDKLLGYWDTVADRLFKIRNSLNFQGVFRQLALFDPPIDPAMLARATAAGLDVGSIVNGVNQPLPLVRFVFLIQKATEIVQEVKSLGNNLLSAMEKEDGESMALLRAKHERVVMEMVEQVKYGQLQEAKKAKEGLLLSLSLAVQRYTFYERQLGKKPDDVARSIPTLEKFDSQDLSRMSFSAAEPTAPPRDLKFNIQKTLPDGMGAPILSTYEVSEIVLMGISQRLQLEAVAGDVLAGILALIPQTGAIAAPGGGGADTRFGGQHLHAAMSGFSSGVRGIAGLMSFGAEMAAKFGNFERREQDWAYQSNLAAGEINQIFKQIRAAEIREAIAELELKSHRQQMKHADEIEHFLNEEGTSGDGKKTNKALYAWMKREVKGLYAQCFQFAFDIAKKAERALQHELGNQELSYLQFGYLAGKEGLLAGERLHLDLKRMEMAFHELNQREYELSKDISLLQLDPQALINLRTTGQCTVNIPEELFDIGGWGEYFRRIKSVALSIPCVVGPHVSVNCKLTLLKSCIRKNSASGDQYARVDADDSRFDDYFGSTQSIVTSFAQNDSGMFETNLRDERYLPFENQGVVSEWRLELPGNPSKKDEICQFDYNTISDVILHVRYTAREGGNILADAARKNFSALTKESLAAGQARLFSVRQEFPDDWAKFLKSKPQETAAPVILPLKVRNEHYPFWCQDLLHEVTELTVMTRSDRKSTVASKTLGKADLGGLSPVGEIRLSLDRDDYADVWFMIKWNA